jgi:long-chain acyl-CoA synthetase
MRRPKKGGYNNLSKRAQKETELRMNHPNLPSWHRYQAEKLGPRPAVRFKRHGTWRHITWERYRADAAACAAALIEAGVQPGDRVALVAENRPEWLVADLGILTAGAVNVPPHAPLTARQIQFQLADSGSRWLFVSTSAQLEKIEPVLDQLPAVKGIVVFDSGCHDAGVCPWERFLQRGRELYRRLAAELTRREAALGPNDLATIMYTSGTTGNPKGVMLTHGNLLSNALAMQEASPRSLDSVPLCWLPLSHIYARTVDHYASLVEGVTLCLSASPESVVQDLEDVHPTGMSAVPRFYEKVLAAVADADHERSARRLREVFGPRVDWLSSGGAPLSRPVEQAYHAAGVLVLQGYGLTESSPVISFNRKTCYRPGTVGPPIPGVEVRIAADGEILTRGPHVMKGYWNDPAATAEAIRAGWLHTGDLGSLDDGFLTITGRKKELLVLSNGKKVVPTHIEGLLLAEECIDQAVVCGEGRPFLTALVVPHWDNLRRELQSDTRSVAQETSERLAHEPAVYSLLEHKIAKALVDVAPWEQVQQFVVLAHAFTVAAEELTVSLKLRRKVVLAKYAPLLDRLYSGVRSQGRVGSLIPDP